MSHPAASINPVLPAFAIASLHILLNQRASFYHAQRDEEVLGEFGWTLLWSERVRTWMRRF